MGTSVPQTFDHSTVTFRHQIIFDVKKTWGTNVPQKLENVFGVNWSL